MLFYSHSMCKSITCCSCKFFID